MKVRIIFVAMALCLFATAKVNAQASTNAQQSGCWGCFSPWLGNDCKENQPQGSWNCTWNWLDGAHCSSPGCGGGASIPLGVDGSALYASWSESADENNALIRRPCDGVLIARSVTAIRSSQIMSATERISL